MGWRYHGHARVNARHPQSAGICDRCGCLYNRVDLCWQFDYTGTRLQNLRILVCPRCLDVPQQQLRARILSADPIPIFQPRPEQFAGTSQGQSVGTSPIETQSFFLTDLNAVLTTENGVLIVPEGVYYGQAQV